MMLSMSEIDHSNIHKEKNKIYILYHDPTEVLTVELIKPVGSIP